MRCSALFALPVVLCIVTAARAQDSSAQQDKASQTTPDSAASPNQASSKPAAPPMTPRQVAEMRADILMARKEFSDAIKSYDQILSTEPRNSAVLNKVGVAYQQLYDLNHAGRYYKRAMKADKSFASPVNNLGTVEFEMKHYGRAIGLYKKALVFQTDLPTVYSNLGYAYFENKEFPEAMKSFGKALSLDPDILSRHAGYGSIVQQRTTTDPGLFYFFVAKTYASAGDAERTAHYLKLARDQGYKNFLSAQTDPAFAKVIKDPRVREVLVVPPSYAGTVQKPVTN
jgi:tetratricopeptide (TPR) repeat protein